MRGPSPRQSYIHTEVIDRSKIQLEDHVVSKDWAISKYSTKQVLNATQLRDAFESVSIKQKGQRVKISPPPQAMLYYAPINMEAQQFRSPGESAPGVYTNVSERINKLQP
jgi:hypothetical protein